MGNSSSKSRSREASPAAQRLAAQTELSLQSISIGAVLTGKIDPTYLSIQRDFFESGLAAKIGSKAFMTLCAIKAHADFRNGVCYPSIRRLMELTRSASSTVQTAIDQLQKNRLLHIYKKSQPNRYIAREHLSVTIGDLKLCTIIINYVPANLQQNFRQISDALLLGELDISQWPDAEIIPAAGFSWQQRTGLQKILAATPSQFAPNPDILTIQNAWSEKIRNIQEKAQSKKKGVCAQ